MELREAEKSDLEEVFDLWWNELMQYHHDHNKKFYELKEKPEARELEIKHKKEAIDDEDCFLVIAEEGSQVIGFATAKKDERSPVWKKTSKVHIEDIAVSSEHRRKGIGTALVKKIVDWAKQKNAELVDVDIDVNNTPGKALHKDTGFGKRWLKMVKWIDGGEQK